MNLKAWTMTRAAIDFCSGRSPCWCFPFCVLSRSRRCWRRDFVVPRNLNWNSMWSLSVPRPSWRRDCSVFQSWWRSISLVAVIWLLSMSWIVNPMGVSVRISVWVYRILWEGSLRFEPDWISRRWLLPLVWEPSLEWAERWELTGRSFE